MDDDSVHDLEDLRAKDFQDLQSTEEGPVFREVASFEKFDFITGHIVLPIPVVFLAPALAVAFAFFVGLNFAWQNSSPEVAEFADQRNSDRARVDAQPTVNAEPVVESPTPALALPASGAEPKAPPKKRKPKAKPTAATPPAPAPAAVDKSSSKFDAVNRLGASASPKVERPGAK